MMGRITIIGLAAYFTLFTQAAADDRVFELWRGQLVVETYDCATRGSVGIIVDEPVALLAGGDVARINCGQLVFRGRGQIRSKVSIEIKVDRLEGPLSIVAESDGSSDVQAAPSTPADATVAKQGHRGRDARSPPNLPFSRFPVVARVGGTGLQGAQGLQGAKGQAGKRGPDRNKGPSVTLFLDHIAAGSSIRIQTGGQGGTAGGRGGAGGKGGDGGRGGVGGAGSKGTSIFLPGTGGYGGIGGNGGQGGNGGPGGDGGAGGDGGNIIVHFTENSFKLDPHIQLQLESHWGGGGTAGVGGPGGLGGSAGEGGWGGAGGLSFGHGGPPDGRIGAKGRHGRHGSSGQAGPPGRRGFIGGNGTIAWGEGTLDISELVARLNQ